MAFFPLWFLCWALAVIIAAQYDRTREWARWLYEAGRCYRYGGFTLIELSIVLVIIGLVVGGVLVGRDLIKAAEVRATIAQIEKYNMAANTFFGKYGALPGDINVAAAQFFQLPNASCTGGIGQRDGNGIIDSGMSNQEVTTSVLDLGEPALFWEDLSAAKLIEGSFSSGACSSGPQPSVAQTGLYMPAAKINNAAFVYVFAYNQSNYFGISVITGWGTGGLPYMQSSPVFPVSQAASIDAKIDDGLPATGRVLAIFVSGGGGVCPTSLSGDTCLSSSTGTSGGNATSCFDTTTGKYSVGYNNGTGVNCGLSFRMQSGD